MCTSLYKYMRSGMVSELMLMQMVIMSTHCQFLTKTESDYTWFHLGNILKKSWLVHFDFYSSFVFCIRNLFWWRKKYFIGVIVIVMLIVIDDDEAYFLLFKDNNARRRWRAKYNPYLHFNFRRRRDEFSDPEAQFDVFACLPLREGG